ncbi:MAG: HAD family hydrolase [Parcubacteria group bacterium]|jgi:putative hydrolase of the HAD superfamily
MKKRIKAVVFDADGVVIDSPSYFSVQYEKEFGVSSNVVQAFFRDKFQDCLVGKADLKEELRPLLDDWKWRGTVEDLLDYWFKAEHYIDERMIDEIKRLKELGIKCYLGTQQEKYRTEYMKSNMGFDRIFDKIYSSAEIGHKKPDKKFFEFIHQDLGEIEGIKPAEIMFWDNEEVNVISAKKLGWQSFLYTTFDDFQKNVSRIK